MVSSDQISVWPRGLFADTVLELRRLRQRLSPSNPEIVEEINNHTAYQRPSLRDPRVASEPSDNVLASILYVQAQESTSHQSSGATSNLSNVGSQGASSSQVPLVNGEPLGFSVIHDCQSTEFDIIFVHGLGGSSYKTWSWNRETRHFWPEWLSLDPELGTSRIFTFGYNANFKGACSNLNIIDFARDLLLRMLTFSGGNAPARPIGTVRRSSAHHHISARLANSDRFRTQLSLLLIPWAA